MTDLPGDCFVGDFHVVGRTAGPLRRRFPYMLRIFVPVPGTVLGFVSHPWISNFGFQSGVNCLPTSQFI